MHVRHIPLALVIACVGSALAQDSIVFTQSANAAQPSNRAVTRRTVAGTVVNSVTGEPIRRALVQVNDAESHSGFTNANGRFEFTNVPEGRIWVIAQKPGFFVDAMPGSALILPSGPIGLTMLSAASGDIVVKLAPEATVRGRVLDKDGEPVEALQIQLMARFLQEGRWQWQHRGQAQTDETGAYAIEGLMPGSYAIHTLPLGTAPAVAGVVVNGANPSEVFLPTYYPEAADLASVQPFELKAGEELPVDFTLSAAPSYRVSGVVTGGHERAGVMCQDANGQPIGRGGPVDPRTGRFTISSVPPGSWVVRAFSQFGQNNGLQAEQAVEVTSADINGLVLPLEPLSSIPVQVQNKPESQGVMVSLTPISGSQNQTFQSFREPGNEKGSILLRGIPPGKYRVSARVFDNSGCVEGLTSGSTDLLRDDLTVLAGSPAAPIEVSLGSDCATISGTVHSSFDQPPSSFIILLSDSSPAVPQSIHTGTDGKFSFANLSPGNYRVFAFDNISDLEYANPEALRGFTGQEVTVGSNAKTSVQVDLVTRGK